MHDTNARSPGRGKLTLAIDIGGSHLKAGIVDERAALVGKPARVVTPSGAAAEEIVATLVSLVRPLGHFDRVSVGFPGVVRKGRVLTAPNLGSDPWHGFSLGRTLEQALGRPVRVLNDASVQGLGAIEGTGIELVLTLGTGMGFALFTNGRLAPHLEMSQHPAWKKKTYDQYIGDAALRKIGHRRWNRRVGRAIDVLGRVTGCDLLYIGGGNARHLAGNLPRNVRIVSNRAGITGGVRLWDPRHDAMFGEPAPAFDLAARIGEEAE
ncbi:MAG: ROK family protein [Acetobacteraceae bacterium]